MSRSLLVGGKGQEDTDQVQRREETDTLYRVHVAESMLKKACCEKCYSILCSSLAMEHFFLVCMDSSGREEGWENWR